jgi:predicted transcriptional regulator
MVKKMVTDKLSIYIPQSKMAEKPVERLIALSEKRDRSVNYLVVEAILEYLDRQEKTGGKKA